MKKRTIIALVVAVCLLFAGGLLLMLGLSYAGNRENDRRLIRQEVTVIEQFDRIDIDTDTCDVSFAMFSGRDDCIVEFQTYEKVHHNVTVENGTLQIKTDEPRNWTDFIGIFDLFGDTESMKITVYLPAAEYEALQVRTATGDIFLGQEPAFREAVLRSDTGDIDCAGIHADVLDCTTSTGEVSVQNSASTLMKLQSGTGDIEISLVKADEIHMITNTGDAEAQKVNVRMLTATSNTGEVELDQVTAADYLQVFTDTGDIGIEGCDAGTVNIETDTGDVEGYFLTPKCFTASSDTGNVTVPEGLTGGECRIETETGNIHFR